MSNLIDRSALGIGYADPNCFDDPKYADGWNSAISIINAAPTVDAEPVRHGRWDNIPNTYMTVASKFGSYSGYATSCSACREVNPNAYKTNYCPNCGAKMYQTEADAQ